MRIEIKGMVLDWPPGMHVGRNISLAQVLQSNQCSKLKTLADQFKPGGGPRPWATKRQRGSKLFGQNCAHWPWR